MPGSNFVAEDGDESHLFDGLLRHGRQPAPGGGGRGAPRRPGTGLAVRRSRPYQVHLAALGAGRSPEVAAAADRLYQRLAAAGVEVLYDDRDVSPGVKFADADLLGLPVRLVVGGKGLARGVVEWRSRATGEEREMAVDATGGRSGRALSRGPTGGEGCPGPGGPGGRSDGTLSTGRIPVKSHVTAFTGPERPLLYFLICRSVGVK